MAIFGQWQGFGSERGFYRSAQRHLRPAFPPLPSREQCNRQVRQHHAALVAFFLHLVPLWAAQRCAYAALDSAGVPTRAAKRRGAGWLPGWADNGWRNRLGWDEGFHLLLAVNPVGGDYGLWLWPGQYQGSTAGGHLLCPASPASPWGAEGRAPSSWPLCGR